MEIMCLLGCQLLVLGRAEYVSQFLPGKFKNHSIDSHVVKTGEVLAVPKGFFSVNLASLQIKQM